MKHVVVGIISRKNANSRNEFLLVSSKRNFGKYTGFYYPPGGHLEEGEDEETALKREILEELGIDVVPTEKIAETSGDVKNQVTHWWRCDQIFGSISFDKKELSDAGYFTREKMKSLDVWPATRRFFQKFIFTNKQE